MAVHCVLWSISLRFVGTRSVLWLELCSQASDYTQARYYFKTPHTHSLKLHRSVSMMNIEKLLLSRNVSCVCFSSSQNSTDWCTYSLQRRRVNTSTSTIDRRTHYHKVENTEVMLGSNSRVFRALTLTCHTLKKLPRTLIPRRRRRRGMMILTARKRRKTRRKKK